MSILHDDLSPKQPADRADLITHKYAPIPEPAVFNPIFEQDHTVTKNRNQIGNETDHKDHAAEQKDLSITRISDRYVDTECCEPAEKR